MIRFSGVVSPVYLFDWPVKLAYKNVQIVFLIFISPTPAKRKYYPINWLQHKVAKRREYLISFFFSYFVVVI